MAKGQTHTQRDYAVAARKAVRDAKQAVQPKLVPHDEQKRAPDPKKPFTIDDRRYIVNL